MQDVLLQIILPLTTFIIGIIIAYLNYKSQLKSYKLEKETLELDKKKFTAELEIVKKESQERKLKLDFFSSVMHLTSANNIVNAVHDIFDKTKADRFLILVAINGKRNFNMVSVIFEQHKGEGNCVNAVGTYRDVKIDRAYKEMLSLSEAKEYILLNTEEMDDSLLKSFYQIEGVKHAQIRFLGRQKIDDDNDFVIFSSLATHKIKPFTKNENVIIKTIYESVIQYNIDKVTT